MIAFLTKNYYHNYRRSTPNRGKLPWEHHWLVPRIYSTDILQGCVLGLFFTIFMKDLPGALQFAKRMPYAYGNRIYLHFLSSEIYNAIALMHHDAQTVSNMATTNGLELNICRPKEVEECISLENRGKILLN